MKNSFFLLIANFKFYKFWTHLCLGPLIYLGIFSLVIPFSLNAHIPRILIDFFVPPITDSNSGFSHQPIFPQSNRSPRNQEIARTYLRSAVQAYNLGSSDQVQLFVKSAFEYDDSLSDGWYLAAMVALEREFPSIALELIEQSLGLNRFIHFSYELVETYYTATLHRLQMYDQIIDYFYLPNSTNPLIQFRMVHPDQTYYLLDAIDRTSRRSTYAQSFRQALLSFPDDPRIQVLQSPLGFPPSLRIEQFLQLSQIHQERHLAAIDLFIERLDSGDVRRDWIQRFIQLGGDPSNRMLRFYIEDTLVDEQRLTVAMNDLILQRSFLDIFEASLMDQLLENTPYQDQFLNFFLSQSRDRYPTDRNLDGFPQEWYHLDQGQLIEWHSDHDQDNLIDHMIRFSEGVPQTYSYQNQFGLWNFYYGNYPFLSYVEFFPFIETEDSSANDHYVKRYYLRPLEIEFAIISPQIPLGPQLVFPSVFVNLVADLQDRFDFVTNRLEQESYRIEQLQGNQPFLETRYSPYQILSREDFDSSGIYERYLVDFPEEGLTLEFFDLDENGWYEYVLIHGIPGIYYRSRDSQGFMVDYNSMEPGTLTLNQQDIIHRYQNILYFRGQAQ